MQEGGPPMPTVSLGLGPSAEGSRRRCSEKRLTLVKLTKKQF